MTSSALEHDLDSTLSPLTAEESERLEQAKQRYGPDLTELSTLLYERLPKADQTRFILWFAKRWAGIDRLSADEYSAYAQAIERIRSHSYVEQVLDGQTYKQLALAPQGYHGELLTYPWMLGIHDFLFDQYQHGDFRIQPGDTIIDAGAFVGDTTLLLHQVTGGNSHIHSFEVLEENLKLLRHNLSINDIAAQVDVCSLALSDQSEDSVYIKATPVQGAASIFGSSDGIQVKTITIDDYVQQESIERVDFIKMDIEGAERLALAGALNTLRRHRPSWLSASTICGTMSSKFHGSSARRVFRTIMRSNGWSCAMVGKPYCWPRQNLR